MVTVVISEKGGAERRERFTHDELTIGRVKGNDILLAKGNVSKKHARLLYRDGRYIVTDLKSTNGTYVNHRRITHATLVRQGDRIYIGDFVLKIEDPLTSDSEQQSEYSSSNASSDERMASLTATSSANDVVSHFPIERDPDEDSSRPVGIPAAAGLPRDLHSTMSSGENTKNSGKETASRPSLVPASTLEQEEKENERIAVQRMLNAVIQEVEDRLGLTAPSKKEPDVESGKQAIKDAIAKLDADQSEDLLSQTLQSAAEDELFGLGPIGDVLDDENVTRIDVMGGQLRIQGRTDRHSAPSFNFATEAGVSRALRRLQQQRELSGLFEETEDTENTFVDKHALSGGDSGKPGIIKATIRGGWQLFALTAPLVNGSPIISLDREVNRAVESGSLVRAGVLSRNMATFLRHCISARANIIIVGSDKSLTDRILNSFPSELPAEHTATWLGSESQGANEQVSTIVLDEEGADIAMDALLKLAPDHVFVPQPDFQWLEGLMDAIQQGCSGVAMSMRAPTLRQGISRLHGQLARRPATAFSPANPSWLGGTFDIGIEVVRLRDGRTRVARITEICTEDSGLTLKDVFVFTYQRTAVGGSIEGAFHATGHVPEVVQDLAAHGVALDTAMFRRHYSL